MIRTPRSRSSSRTRAPRRPVRPIAAPVGLRPDAGAPDDGSTDGGSDDGGRPTTVVRRRSTGEPRRSRRRRLTARRRSRSCPAATMSTFRSRTPAAILSCRLTAVGASRLPQNVALHETSQGSNRIRLGVDPIGLTRPVTTPGGSSATDEEPALPVRDRARRIAAHHRRASIRRRRRSARRTSIRSIAANRRCRSTHARQPSASLTAT